MYVLKAAGKRRDTVSKNPCLDPLTDPRLQTANNALKAALWLGDDPRDDRYAFWRRIIVAQKELRRREAEEHRRKRDELEEEVEHLEVEVEHLMRMKKKLLARERQLQKHHRAREKELKEETEGLRAVVRHLSERGTKVNPNTITLIPIKHSQPCSQTYL